MTGDCKYITFDAGGRASLPVTIVVFPAFVEHKTMAVALREMMGPPINAGFVSYGQDGPTAYGKSLSLDLQSSPVADTLLLRRLMS